MEYLTFVFMCPNWLVKWIITCYHSSSCCSCCCCSFFTYGTGNQGTYLYTFVIMICNSYIQIYIFCRSISTGQRCCKRRPHNPTLREVSSSFVCEISLVFLFFTHNICVLQSSVALSDLIFLILNLRGNLNTDLQKLNLK